MRDKKYYLSEYCYVEPLVNHWYAWPSLLQPLTYSMYFQNTHKRLMKSFVNNYELHILANQDKEIAGGGEFLDCTEEQVGNIQDLLDKFNHEFGIFSEISNAIKELDELLRNHRSGTSLEPLYERVPDILKGYVELVMDINHNPSFRIIEGLLYKGPLMDEMRHGLMFDMLSKNKHRPFALSTPRFQNDENLFLEVNFDSTDLDEIFKTRDNGKTIDELDAIFSKYDCPSSKFLRYFTEDREVKRKPICSDKINISFTGHAGILIESDTLNILIDPVIASKDPRYEDIQFSFGDLPNHIDFVLLTHNHADHVNIETLIQLRHKIDKVIVPKNNGGTLQDPSLKLVLESLNFSVLEFEDMEEIHVSKGKIQAIPFLGEHGDLNIRSKTGWFLELNNKKIYAAADSSNLEPRLYENIASITGELDLLAIGMECVGAPYTWLYGALNTQKVPKEIRESRKLNGSNFETAKNMLHVFNAKSAIVYALGMEEWFSYFMGIDYSDSSEQMIQSSKFVDYCSANGIPANRVCGKFETTL